MARGHPDFAASVGTTPEGKFLQNLAQAPIWFHDDFEDPIKKWSTTFGTVVLDSTPAADLSFANQYFGSTALKITSDAGDIGGCRRTIGPPPLTTEIGFSCFFKMVTKADFADAVNSVVVLSSTLYDGTNYRVFNISYNPRDNQWSIQDGGDFDDTVIATTDLLEGAWHYVKLIVDPVNGKYRSFQIDTLTVDLTAYTFYVDPDTDPISMTIFLSCTGDAADQAIMYVDDYKITYGES